MIGKIETAVGIIRLYKNWHKVMMTYLGTAKRNTKPKYVLRNGVEYEVASDEDWTAITEIWSSKIYTPCGNELQENYKIIDIGAHVGIFSIFAARQSPTIEVHAYEPNPTNFRLLERNIRTNHLENVKAYKLAVGGTSGERALFTSVEDRGHSFFSEISRSQDYTEVQCVTLRQILDRVGNCDFLKMDCEGAEYEVLFNTPRHYLQKLGTISIECHDLAMSRVNKKGRDALIGDPHNLKSYLEEASFKVALTKPYARSGDGMVLLNAQNLRLGVQEFE